MKISRFSISVATLALLTIITGCTTSNGYQIFDREQTAEDKLPAVFNEKLVLDEFDLSTSRFSVTHDGVDYYLIRKAEDSADGPMQCLAVADPLWPSIGCGSDGVTLSGGGLDTVQLVPAPAQDSDEWTAISDNVRVKPER